MLKKKALILSYLKLSTDPSILRQIECLKSDYDVYNAGLFSSNHGDLINHYAIVDEEPIFHRAWVFDNINHLKNVIKAPVSNCQQDLYGDGRAAEAIVEIISEQMDYQ